MRCPLLCLVLATLVGPAVARADDHNADAYAGGTRHNKGQSSISGWHVAFAKETPWMNKNVGIVLADISLHSQDHDEQRNGQVTFMAGPRITWGIDGTEDTPGIHKVNTQFLVGGYSNYGLDEGANWAVGLGAAYEVMPFRSGILHSIGARIQADRIWRAGNPEAVWRISVGGVYRIH
jgi:hypothetical protein